MRRRLRPNLCQQRWALHLNGYRPQQGPQSLGMAVQVQQVWPGDLVPQAQQVSWAFVNLQEEGFRGFLSLLYELSDKWVAVKRAALCRGAFFDNIAQFSVLDTIKGLSAAIKRFKCFDHGFSHPPMCLFRATNDGEVLSSSDAFVTVFIVQTKTDQVAIFTFRCAHDDSSCRMQRMSAKAASC